MRLWTDGTTTMLLCSKGMVRWHRGEEPVVVKPLAPDTYVADYQRDGMLAMTPSGIDRTEQLRSIGAIEAAFLDEERVAAIIARDEQYVLALGDTSGRWTQQIPLHDIEAPNVAWPKGLIYAQHGDAVFGDEPPPRGIPFGHPARLTVNRWGIAISSDSSGVAVLVRPDRDAVELAMRFPWVDSNVDAMATELGMLVTYVIQARETALFHLATSGEVIATRQVHGSPPALLVEGGFLVLDEQEEHIQFLDHHLKPISKKGVGAQRGDSAVSSDGQAFAFADDAVIVVGRVSGSKLISIEGVEYAAALVVHP